MALSSPNLVEASRKAGIRKAPPSTTAQASCGALSRHWNQAVASSPGQIRAFTLLASVMNSWEPPKRGASASPCELLSMMPSRKANSQGAAIASAAIATMLCKPVKISKANRPMASAGASCNGYSSRRGR